MKKAGRQVLVETQASEMEKPLHKAKKPRIESKLTSSDVFNEHSTLDALQVVALLKGARETDNIRDGIRTCVRMAQSAMRYVLVENLSDSQIHTEQTDSQPRKKSKNNAKESEQQSRTLKETRDELQAACQSSPYHFLDRENMMEVLWTSLDILKQRYQSLPEDTNAASKINFKPFWMDIKRFLKHKGPESDLSRILICGLEGLYDTSPMNLAAFKYIMEKIIEITVHSNSVRCSTLLKSLKCLSDTMIKSCQQTDEILAAESQELLKLFVRRLLHHFNTWHAAIKNVTQLNIARETLPTLIDILHETQLVNAETVYNECYHAINKLTELLSTKAQVTATKPSKQSSKNKKPLKEAPSRSSSKIDWPCLFNCFIWIKVLSLEDLVDTKYSLTPVRDALATILLTIARIHLQETNKAPIVFKAFSLLNLLAECTQRFVPMGIMLLQFGYRIAAELEAQSRVVPGAKLGQIQTIANILKVRNEDFSVKLKEDLVFEYLRITLDFLKLMAHHPAFPETAHLILMHLKKISKTIKQSTLRSHLKTICEAGEKSQRKIEAFRHKLNINEIPSSLFIISPSDFATLDIASVKTPQRSLDFWLVDTKHIVKKNGIEKR